MSSNNHVATSKEIQRRTGRTFHVATRLLPRRVREPTYVLYAFFRVADEVVDDPDPAPPGVQRAELDRIRAAALGERVVDDPVLSAFADLRERHGIPDREVNVFVDAMAMDVEKRRYDTVEELETYLRGSSVAVGNMMLAVMDPKDREAARPHAKALAEAFQLTNFLRDVREDVLDYDRIYLPRSTLAAHGVPETDVEDLRFSEGFAAAMRDELRRTEALYREGIAGIEYLPRDCQFGVLLAAVLYAEHHRLIRERGYDVLSSRPTLTTARRLALVAKTWWHWRRLGDPAAAFAAASAIPAGDSAVTPADGVGDAGETDDPAGVRGDRSIGTVGRRVARPARSVVGRVRTRIGAGGAE